MKALNEKGIAAPMFVVFLTCLLFVSVFVFDLARVLVFRHELGAIADSISLAGVSEKILEPIEEYDRRIDTNVVVGYNPVIDPEGAEREARTAANKNRLLLQQQGNTEKRFTSWTGQVKNNVEYEVDIYGEIDTILYASVMELLGAPSEDYETIPIHVKSISKLKLN